MFRNGIRTFTVASLLTAVIGVLHTMGLANDPPGDAWVEAYEAARAATLEAGPFSMSFYGIFVGVWIQVGALLVMLGVKNILAVWIATNEPIALRLVQRLAMFDATGCAALAALFVYFQIPPPLVSFALLAVLFALAAIFSGRVASSPGGMPAS